jgi:hypothetical protein
MSEYGDKFEEQFEEINPEYYQEDREESEELDFEEPEVDELTQEFVNKLIDKMLWLVTTFTLIKSLWLDALWNQ